MGGSLTVLSTDGKPHRLEGDIVYANCALGVSFGGGCKRNSKIDQICVLVDTISQQSSYNDTIFREFSMIFNEICIYSFIVNWKGKLEMISPEVPGFPYLWEKAQHVCMESVPTLPYTIVTPLSVAGLHVHVRVP